MIPLPYLAAARVEGEDAAAFLHAQLSADIASLAPGQSSFACYCSPRGQVLGLLLVGRLDRNFVLLGSAALLPGLLARLGRFVLRAKVHLSLAPQWTCQGLADGDEAAAPQTELAPPGVGLRYGLAVAAPDVSPEPTGGAMAWKAEELQRGVAWLDAATSERFIPQMLGFDTLGAVSFSKGCYPGQEIVARARYLGQVKRKPLRVRLAEAVDIAAGAAVQIRGESGAAEAIVVDAAIRAASGETSVLLVAPELEVRVEAIELEGRAYRCATM